MTITRAHTLPCVPRSGCRRAERLQTPTAARRSLVRRAARRRPFSWFSWPPSRSPLSSASTGSAPHPRHRTISGHRPRRPPSDTRGTPRARDLSPPPGPRASRRRGDSPLTLRIRTLPSSSTPKEARSTSPSSPFWDPRGPLLRRRMTCPAPSLACCGMRRSRSPRSSTRPHSSLPTRTSCSIPSSFTRQPGDCRTPLGRT